MLVVVGAGDEAARRRRRGRYGVATASRCAARAPGAPIAMPAAYRRAGARWWPWPASATRAVLRRSCAAAGWRVATTLPLRRSPLVHPGGPRPRSRAPSPTHGAWGALTTEKDAVRLEPLGPPPCPMARVPLRARPGAVAPIHRGGRGGHRAVAVTARPAARGRRHEGLPAAARTGGRARRANRRAAAAVAAGPGARHGARHCRSTSLDRPHRRVALANLAQCFPARSPAERRRDRPAHVRALRRLLFELLKFSTLSHEAMRQRVEFEGEDIVRASLRQGQGRAVLHRPLRLLGAARHRARAAAQPIGVLARALDNPGLHDAARAGCASAPATP